MFLCMWPKIVQVNEKHVYIVGGTDPDDMGLYSCFCLDIRTNKVYKKKNLI